MLPTAVVPEPGATPCTVAAHGRARAVCARRTHDLVEWDAAAAAPGAATHVQPAVAVLTTPMVRAAPSRWASAATTATARATSLPGAAFRESATLRASFWLCRGCDLAWPRGGGEPNAKDVCPSCHIAREDMQLQAGATEVAQVRALVEANSYGRSLGFENSTEQPIGAAPVAFANPHAAGFAETVRAAALRIVGPGVNLSGARTDAIMTFEAWLLLTYDAEFSL